MKRQLLPFWFACLGLSVALQGAVAAQTLSVTESVHNLSPTGPGPVKGTLGNPCEYCHAPHHVTSVTPLWNHQLSTQSYQLYTSSTYEQTNQQLEPGSPSKLCLSCHDGTVALGQTYAYGLVPTTGSLSPTSNLGTDLRRDHPFAFATPFVDDGQLKSTLFSTPPHSGDTTVKLVNNKVECTTCHEPHFPAIDSVVQKFLVRSNSNGALCLACHDPSRPQPNNLAGWTTSAHSTAINSTGGDTATGGYPTVSADACMSCHTPHNGNSGVRLLRQPEEATCAPCHGGSNLMPALLDVMNVVNNSAYRHPIATLSGLHDPKEPLPLSANRHSECPDCHNAHASQAVIGTPTPPTAQVSLAGTSGMSNFDGTTVLKPATNQYEICFKCHANSTNKPQNADYTVYGRTPYRLTYAMVADPYNVRLNFQSTAAWHNVTQPSRGSVAPSLRTAMLDFGANPTGRPLQGSGLYLYCTDCHNNDAARISGGIGPNGPHGSANEHLLERRYVLELPPATPGGSSSGVSYTSGLTGTYALCDKCHDIANSILQDRTFSKHEKHIVENGVSCGSCHVVHGVQGGTSTSNGALINFDTKIAAKSVKTNLFAFDRSQRKCWLTCHGIDHDGWGY